MQYCLDVGGFFAGDWSRRISVNDKSSKGQAQKYILYIIFLSQTHHINFDIFFLHFKFG